MLPRDSNAYAAKAQEAAAVARAVVDGARGICDAGRVLSSLAQDLVSDSRIDPDFVVFVGIHSEV